MYRLKVDFNGCKKGGVVTHDTHLGMSEYMVCGDIRIATEEDIPMLIEHGIIVEVEEPKWTDYDMIAVIAVTMQNTVRMTPSQIFENFQKTKGKQ